MKTRLNAGFFRFCTDDVHHSLHVVCQHAQTHPCIHPVECFAQEVSRSHPSFQGAERMLLGGSTDTHRIRTPVQTSLSALQYRFMLPAGH